MRHDQVRLNRTLLKAGPTSPGHYAARPIEAGPSQTLQDFMKQDQVRLNTLVLI
jgi:hypothetical protein